MQASDARPGSRPSSERRLDKDQNVEHVIANLYAGIPGSVAGRAHCTALPPICRYPTAPATISRIPASR